MSARGFRMTTDEVALMRAIVVWRKANHVTYWRARGVGYFIEWKDRSFDRSVVHDLNDPEISHGRIDGIHDRIEVTSVTQAVDVLVALGYLPQRFSSAYRDGWHAAKLWYGGEEDSASVREFARLFHDPENISFPAVEK